MTRTLTVAAAAVARVFAFRCRRVETEKKARSRMRVRVPSFRFAASACSQKPRVRKESDVSASDCVDWITRSLICVCGVDGRLLCANAAERVGDLCARATTMSEEEEVSEKKGWFSRLATGLAKSVGEGLD